MTEQKVERKLSPGVPYPKPEKKKKGGKGGKGGKEKAASNDDE